MGCTASQLGVARASRSPATEASVESKATEDADGVAVDGLTTVPEEIYSCFLAAAKRRECEGSHVCVVDSQGKQRLRRRRGSLHSKPQLEIGDLARVVGLTSEERGVTRRAVGQIGHVIGKFGSHVQLEGFGIVWFHEVEVDRINQADSEKMPSSKAIMDDAEDVGTWQSTMTPLSDKDDFSDVQCASPKLSIAHDADLFSLSAVKTNDSNGGYGTVTV